MNNYCKVILSVINGKGIADTFASNYQEDLVTLFTMPEVINSLEEENKRLKSIIKETINLLSIDAVNGKKNSIVLLKSALKEKNELKEKTLKEETVCL